MKALREVGAERIVRYALWSAAEELVRLTPTPVARVALLRALGARIGPGSLVNAGIRLRNLDRHRGLRALTLGANCWIGFDCHIDLAADVRFGDEVTLSSRALVSTHLNVGYADHPLHRSMPSMTAPVEVGSGSFVGVGAVLLAGARLGPETFVAAGAVVLGTDYPKRALLAGVPARVVRRFD